jgi:DNA-binding beta-propeller fold protein YncE
VVSSSIPTAGVFISHRREVNPLPSWTPGSNKIIAEIPVGVSPHYAIFTPDGKRGLTAVQGPSLLAVFNAESNAVENSIKVGSRPHWVAAGPDNKTALTANEESNDYFNH